MSNSLRPHGLQHASLSAPHCPMESAHIYMNWTSDAFQPSHPVTLLSFCIRVFSNESALHTRWPKYWIFSFSISPSNEYSGLISFRMDWLDLYAVQETLKSLLQHHSLKHQFFSALPSLWPSFHIHSWLLERLPQLPRLYRQVIYPQFPPRSIFALWMWRLSQFCSALYGQECTILKMFSKCPWIINS